MIAHLKHFCSHSVEKLVFTYFHFAAVKKRVNRPRKECSLLSATKMGLWSSPKGYFNGKTMLEVNTRDQFFTCICKRKGTQ